MNYLRRNKKVFESAIYFQMPLEASEIKQRNSFNISEESQDDLSQFCECPIQALAMRKTSFKSVSNGYDSPLLKPLCDPDELPDPFELPPSIKFLEESGGSFSDSFDNFTE